jgi:hypothetical protein
MKAIQSNKNIYFVANAFISEVSTQTTALLCFCLKTLAVFEPESSALEANVHFATTPRLQILYVCRYYRLYVALY